ncbi:RNA polymerase sigma factor [Fodinibius salsisoli]|uniref:Sigma-70 family RNA polymerase sigma factor n=1 Tax=Fodinibius salsisoli TaxID=2820877 RepID=A0ABT3PHC0_9BACT|nr:sigma-70 family RNA polymerase sigma factor [Fodinibius salsisoli]MCW9705320.1 sigma-70 family RNA polymerase sigma factor [Fodinibius salsisoli]
MQEARYIQSSYIDSRDECSREELWEAFRGGDEKALSELFVRYYAKLYRYGMKLLSDEEAAKDGIQQLFLKLWNNRADIGRAESVTFYLLKSLRRILFRKKKQLKSRRRRNKEYMQNFISLPRTIEDEIVVAERKVEQKERLEKAYKVLTDKQKEALFLRLQHGLRNKEIADVMALSHQRVRNLIYEATKRLKSHLS